MNSERGERKGGKGLMHRGGRAGSAYLARRGSR